MNDNVVNRNKINYVKDNLSFQRHDCVTVVNYDKNVNLITVNALFNQQK